METEKKSTGGRAFLGFLLTFLMTIALIVNGLVMSVKTTILNGSDVSEILENLNVYEVLSDLISSEISKATTDDSDTDEDTDSEAGVDVSVKEIAKVATTADVTPSDDTADTDSINISEDAINAIFGEDILKEITKVVTDSIKNEQDVDLSGVKDKCMVNVEDLALSLIDDVVDEIEEMDADTLSAETVKNLSSVQKIKKDYGVDVDTIVSDFVQNNHGSDTINIADVDFEALRTEAKSTVKNDVMPKLDKTMDTYIADVSKTVNDSIKDANEAYNISGLINGVEDAVSTLNIVMLSCIIVAVVFAALQFLIYRTCINRACRNIFISTLISGIFTLIFAMFVGTAKNLVSSILGSDGDAITKAVSKLIVDNIGAVGDRMLLIAIVYIVVAILALVASIVIKKKLYTNSDEPNNGMGTLSEGGVLNN